MRRDYLHFPPRILGRYDAARDYERHPPILPASATNAGGALERARTAETGSPHSHNRVELART